MGGTARSNRPQPLESGIKFVNMNEPNIEAIMQVGLGFWASKTLLSAIEMEVFTELAHGAEDLNSLQGRLGLHPRSARDFLDALVALGFLQRVNGKYSNTPSTDKFLDKRKPILRRRDAGDGESPALPLLGQSHGRAPDRRIAERSQGRRPKFLCRALRRPGKPERLSEGHDRDQHRGEPPYRQQVSLEELQDSG